MNKRHQPQFSTDIQPNSKGQNGSKEGKVFSNESSQKEMSKSKRKFMKSLPGKS